MPAVSARIIFHFLSAGYDVQMFCFVCSMPGCFLKNNCWQVFASVLSSNSQLRELDLSRNDLKDLGVQLLSVGLGSLNCSLETLRY